MSGKGQASGSDYEADVFAYISAHILAGEALPWFNDPYDVPVAVWLQKGKGSPGDDFVAELRDGGVIEVQAKHGASGNDDFISAAVRLFAGLERDPHSRGVIIVDSSSTGSVRTEFDEDVRRFADGIDIEPDLVMQKVLTRLRQAGIQLQATTLRRFRLVVSDLGPGLDAAALAQHVLGRVLEVPSQRTQAWELLGREALRVAKRAGRQDASALAVILKPISGVVSGLTSEGREQYVEWAIEANASFLLAPLPDVQIDTLVAWDELLPVTTPDNTTRDADAIRTYHGWEKRRENATVRDTKGSRELLEQSRSAVIIGGAGAGKSTFTRKLVREACEGGFLAFRVALKQVALAVQEGKSFDDALVESAFQGFGRDLATQRLLLSRADFLIADGLDEAGPVRSAVATHLLSWSTGHPKAAVIITTRPVGHSAGLLPGISTFELNALSWGGALRMAEEIFGVALGDADRASEAAERFEMEVATNRHAGVAARNPLMLSCMVALSIEGRPLPKDVPTLYAEIIDLLRRTIPHDRVPSAESVDVASAWIVAEEVAWLLSGDPTVTRDNIAVRVAERLKREGIGGQIAATRAAENALLFWEEHRLLERLRIGTREYLTFVHLNLGEYAAARAIGRFNDAQLMDWLTHVHRQPQWREVILLAAAAGAAERIANLLLDLDEPAEPISEEAFLAAECLEDLSAPDADVLQRTVESIGARLGGPAELRAGDVLIRLARFRPAAVSAVCLPLLESSSHVTRLSAEAGVFSGDPTLVPAGLPRKWLEEYAPIQTIFIGKHRPERLSPLPEEARDLHDLTVTLAVNCLFRVTSRDEAVAVVQKLLPNVWILGLNTLHSVLRRHGAADLIEPFVTKNAEMAMSFMPRFDTPEYRDELLAILDAIAASVGSPEGDEDGSRRTLPLLSRVLGALKFWKLELHRLHNRRDQQSLELVIDRTLRGMRVDREDLRRELASAYRIANALTGRGIYAHVREVAVRVNWRTAAAEPIETEPLIRALVHSADVVTYVAVELLQNGAADDRARDVIAGALSKGRHFTCFLLTQVAPDVIGIDAATDVLRARLRDGDDRPWSLHGVFEGLKMSAATWKYSLYDETTASLTRLNSYVATAAAEALEAMNYPCDTTHVAALRDAWEFWSNHSGWCERCEIEVTGFFCSKCHTGIQLPFASIVRQLIRCRELSEAELRSLLSNENPDVKRIANEALAAMRPKNA